MTRRAVIAFAVAASLTACATPPAVVTMSDALPTEAATASVVEAAASSEPADVVGSITPAPTAAAAVTVPVTAAPIIPPPPIFTPIAPTAQACCKVCRAGKACGDTCIARNKTCHVGRGCACDG